METTKNGCIGTKSEVVVGGRGGVLLSRRVQKGMGETDGQSDTRFLKGRRYWRAGMDAAV